MSTVFLQKSALWNDSIKQTHTTVRSSIQSAFLLSTLLVILIYSTLLTLAPCRVANTGSSCQTETLTFSPSHLPFLSPDF